MKKLIATTILVLCIVIGAFAQSGTTGPLTWTLSKGTLTISGSGGMPNYDFPDSTSDPAPPWHNSYIFIKSVVIQEGVTSISKCAFQQLSYITSVTIPSSVTSIGWMAFYGCSALTTVTFNAINCKTMGNVSVFMDCKALTKLI